MINSGLEGYFKNGIVKYQLPSVENMLHTTPKIQYLTMQEIKQWTNDYIMGLVDKYENKTKVASILGMNRTTLVQRIKLIENGNR